MTSSGTHAPLQPVLPLSKDEYPHSLPELVHFIDQSFSVSPAHGPDPSLSQKIELRLYPATRAVVGLEHKSGGHNTSAEEKGLELDLLTRGWANQGLRTKGLAVLMLLCRRLSSSASLNYPIPADQLLPLAQRIVQECPATDLRLAGKGLDYVSADLFELARENNQLPAMLQTFAGLAHARAHGSRETSGARGVLVPGHRWFLEACLLTRQLEAARSLLDTPILGVSMMQNAQEVLSYYYLGGMVYLGLREWEKARDFFETAVTFPGSSVSAVQIAAHKKLVLVQLILTGKTYAYPKYLSSIVQRAIKGHTAVYNEFAEAFQALDEKKIFSVRDKHGPEFVADENLGLAQCVIDTLIKRKLLKLNKTYKKLEVAEVARLIGFTGSVEEMQNIIHELIALREIGAHLITDNYPETHAPRISIEFVDPEDSFDTAISIGKIAQLKAIAAQRTRVLVLENRALGMNTKWLNSAVKFESESVQTVAADLLAGVPGGAGTAMGTAGPPRVVRGVGSNWADTGF